jgi:hypothetical protein
MDSIDRKGYEYKERKKKKRKRKKRYILIKNISQYLKVEEFSFIGMISSLG